MKAADYEAAIDAALKNGEPDDLFRALYWNADADRDLTIYERNSVLAAIHDILHEHQEGPDWKGEC